MKVISLAVCVALSILVNPRNATAQVVPDDTLSTTVTRTNSDFEINDGDRIGNNLFHSFDQFSVPTGGLVLLSNSTDIQNIFSRVTGDSLSIIDGWLEVMAIQASSSSILTVFSLVLTLTCQLEDRL